MKRDIIFTINNCGGKLNCKKEAEKFREPPIIINNIPIAQDIDTVLKLVLEKKKINPKRVAFISLGLGSALVNHILSKSKNLKIIDTIIIIEDINALCLNVWRKFAKQSELWLVNSQNKVSKDINKKIILPFKSTRIDYINNKKYKYITKPIFSKKPIKIYSKTEIPKTKLYHEDTLLTFNKYGNIYHLEYSGASSHDQTYISQYVQPRLWEMLRNKWK